jgi:hypothetical protein
LHLAGPEEIQLTKVTFSSMMNSRTINMLKGIAGTVAFKAAILRGGFHQFLVLVKSQSVRKLTVQTQNSFIEPK